MRRLTSLSLTLLLLLAIGGAAAENNVAIVEIRDFTFTPHELTIKPGTTVRWVNMEKRQYHSVWFREAGDKVSEYFFPGEYYEHTFEKEGDFPYVCEPHMDEMSGVIHVVK